MLTLVIILPNKFTSNLLGIIKEVPYLPDDLMGYSDFTSSMSSLLTIFFFLYIMRIK
jgi:hypothetical protein